jgi:hypothetical protein
LYVINLRWFYLNCASRDASFLAIAWVESIRSRYPPVAKISSAPHQKKSTVITGNLIFAE